MTVLVVVVLAGAVLWMLSRQQQAPSAAGNNPHAIYDQGNARYIDRTFDLATMFMWVMLIFFGVKGLSALTKAARELN